MRTRRHNAGFVLLFAPWWLNLALAVFCFAGIRYGLPYLAMSGGPIVRTISAGMQPLAPYAAIVFLILASIGIVVELRRLSQTAKLAKDGEMMSQPATVALGEVSWVHFRTLLAEGFKRRNFIVEVSDGRHGADLILHTGPDRWVVNCSNWLTDCVGVTHLHRLQETMAAEGAVCGVFVTSGGFTHEALDFSAGRSIYLIDGPQLAEMLASIEPGHPPN